MENWKAEISKAGRWAVYRMPGYYGVFDHTAPGESLKSCERRARLIAAAPKLLAALAHMLGAAEADCMDDKSNVWRSYMLDARAALAKARGA